MPDVKADKLLKCVLALLKYVKKNDKEKNFFLNSDKPVLLMVSCVKIPKVPLHQMRILLPHSMVTSTDDVALFVSDLKKGRRRDFDDSIQRAEELLRKHNCNAIRTIIPLNQVKTEYRQFEMRRKLLGLHDYFLADGRISGHLAHLLGKTFRNKRKLPTPIHMNSKDLKKEIDVALRKTSLEIHGNGDNSIVQIGTCSMDAKSLAENIMAVIEKIKEDFPGGWENIKSLRIKTPLSLALPVYINLKSRNNIKIPVQNPKRPKAYCDVTGELSTFTSNVHVTVSPDGTVKVAH